MARTGVAEGGPSEAALLSEEESDCIDSERCLLRLVEPTSKSVVLDDGDAAGDGKLIAVKGKKGVTGGVTIKYSASYSMTIQSECPRSSTTPSL